MQLDGETAKRIKQDKVHSEEASATTKERDQQSGETSTETQSEDSEISIKTLGRSEGQPLLSQGSRGGPTVLPRESLALLWGLQEGAGSSHERQI